jgi:hypothetical protein
MVARLTIVKAGIVFRRLLSAPPYLPMVGKAMMQRNE